MRGSENRHILLFWIRPASLGLILLVSFFISCDVVERHRALTFFFDGVPPLELKDLQGLSLDPNSPELIQAGQSPAWFVHEPRKDCRNCHSKRRRRSFTPETILIAPIPKLCYGCHADFTESASYVHGPVAVGQCLLCHNPHKSKIEHLLLIPEPGLCYQCHDINTIESVAAHLPGQLSTCTNCHNPHNSSQKALLKDNPSQTNFQFNQPKTLTVSSQNDILIAKGQDEQSDSKQGTTSPETQTERNNLSEVFRETSRLIESGELEQARVYLVQFKDSTSFTAKEREQIARVLEMIDSVINTDEKKTEIDKQAKEITDLYYNSMAFYRTGQLLKAREGFIKILKSGSIPESMANTIKGYISDIDNSLAGNK